MVFSNSRKGNVTVTIERQGEMTVKGQDVSFIVTNSEFYSKNDETNELERYEIQIVSLSQNISLGRFRNLKGEEEEVVK